jgi:hypothetical protein
MCCIYTVGAIKMFKKMNWLASCEAQRRFVVINVRCIGSAV